MTTWIKDESGNRASVEKWGSEKTARALADMKRLADAEAKRA